MIPETPVQLPGLRFYSPGIGRWVSRDPIGERGGPNTLTMCRNCTVGVVDAHGLTPAADHAHCERQRLDYESRLKKPESGIRLFWAAITTGLDDCPLPRIQCKCCDVRGLGGEFEPGEQAGSISICENNLSGASGWTDFGNRLRHELVHVAQGCSGFGTKSCADSVCKEIRAYTLDGAHQSRELVLQGVEFSAFPHCIKDVLPGWDPGKTPVDRILSGPEAEAVRRRIREVFGAVYEKCTSGPVGRPVDLPTVLPPEPPPG